MPGSRQYDQHESTRRVTCCGCSLLCSDIEIECGDSTDTTADNACELGNDWLRQAKLPELETCTIQRQPVTFAEAALAVNDLIRNSSLPLVCGLTDQSTETQRAAIHFACEISAAVDWTTGRTPSAHQLALQECGNVSCSFGEIRQRCDLLVNWCIDSNRTHPRFVERFVPAANCHQITVGPQQLRRESDKHEYCSIDKAQLGSFIRLLTRNLSDRNGDRGHDKPIPGAHDDQKVLVRLADQIRNSNYCVFVCDDQLADHYGTTVQLGMAKLVRKINDVTHCRLVRLQSTVNQIGVESALSWLTGFPFAVAFRAGRPIFRPDEFSTPRLINGGIADLILVIGNPAQIPGIGDALEQHKTSTVLISDQVPAGFRSSVFIPSRRLGLEDSGTVYRSDALPVNVASIRQSGLPSVAEIFEMIIADQTTTYA